MINEGIVPMNMSWRSGIGREINNNNKNICNTNKDHQFIDTGIFLSNAENSKNTTYFKPDSSFVEDLINEIDTQSTTILEKYNFNQLNARVLFNIKNDLKNICLNIKNKYNKYLNNLFYQRLYNQCQIAYNENFKNLKEDVNPTTEFIQIDGILYGNPFLIYEFFQL